MTLSLATAVPPHSTRPEALRRALRMNKYFKHFPTPKQAAFLLLPQREAFFGGAGGPGKSDALLMGALQDVHVPGYAALIFRRTYSDLALPGALMDRAHDWLDDTDAHWNGKTHTWEFPSNATMTFGYLEHEQDKSRYRSAELQYIAYDELTQFTLSQYRFLFTRLRRLKGHPVPLRMRSASNPGDYGHTWVKQRFIIEGPAAGRPFIPARLRDNPYLDIDAYRESLSYVDPVTRAQIEEGDWDAAVEGKKFKRYWFTIVPDYPLQAKRVRFWDLASTEPRPGTDPDWTAGALVAEHDGRYTICDMKRLRGTPGKVEALIAQTAALDGPGVDIWIEQEPGASGVNTIDHYQRRILKGYTVRGYRNTGNKETRANPVSSAAEAGNVDLLQGPWITDYLDEAEGFPGGSHDDQVDAVSGGVAVLGVGMPPITFGATETLTQASRWTTESERVSYG